MRRRASLRLAFAVAFGLLAGSACLSPTLPLPPPEVPSAIQKADTEGVWTISGDCDKGAIVTVFNEATGEGAVVEDRDRVGRYTVQIEASLCDLAWVKQETGDDVSARTTFVIEERTKVGPVDPDACP